MEALGFKARDKSPSNLSRTESRQTGLHKKTSSQDFRKQHEPKPKKVEDVDSTLRQLIEHTMHFH